LSFRLTDANGAPPKMIEVSFVEGRERSEDGRLIEDPRLLPDLRSPHLPAGRRSN